MPCLKWSCLLFLNLETSRKKMRSKLGIFCCLTCHCALLLSWFNSSRNLMPNHKKYEIVVPRSNFRGTQTIDLVNTLNFLSPTVKIDCPPCLFWFLPFPGNWLSSHSRVSAKQAYWNWMLSFVLISQIFSLLSVLRYTMAKSLKIQTSLKFKAEMKSWTTKRHFKTRLKRPYSF